MSCGGRICQPVLPPLVPLPSGFPGAFGTCVLSGTLRTFPRLGHGLGQEKSDRKKSTSTTLGASAKSTVQNKDLTPTQSV